MKNMTIKAQSTFHGNISQSFRVPAECGRYPRRCPNPCDNAKDHQTGIAIHCGCGWPVDRTKWEAPEGFVAYAEWADWSDHAGRNNIIIVVEPSHA
jgi:hypothetical protein